MTERVPVRVRVVDAAGLAEWRQAHPVGTRRATIATRGETVLWFGDPDPGGVSPFEWCCPGCGGTAGGQVCDEPGPGQWLLGGKPARPTLAPGLVCPSWLAGQCRAGYWWLRNGILIPADGEGDTP